MFLLGIFKKKCQPKHSSTRIPPFNERTQKNWSWTFWLHCYFACVLDRVDFRATKSMAYHYEVIAWSMTWCQWSMTWCPFGFIDIVVIDVILKLIKVANLQVTSRWAKQPKNLTRGSNQCWLVIFVNVGYQHA